MSDCIKTDALPEYPLPDHSHSRRKEAGRTLLAGVLGGFASAVGYVVYSRLPDQQRERLHIYVRSLVESRMKEIRSTLNI